MITVWLLPGGLIFMLCCFSAAWMWAAKLDHYSMVDAVWAFGIGATSLLWLSMMPVGVVSMVAMAMIATWSVRLGSHLARRIHKAYPHEDARYDKLREVWDGKIARSFFWFYQAQAFSVILISLPFLFIAWNGTASWGAWEMVGLIVFLIGLAGESLADAQMNRFKVSNVDHTAVCKDGLWRFSRHPNYFFESVIWLGIYIYACGSPYGWLTIHAPAIITFLLLKVTGIPPTEASAVRRKGEAYRAYQRTTSAFVPWPPRQDS